MSENSNENDFLKTGIKALSDDDLEVAGGFDRYHGTGFGYCPYCLSAHLALRYVEGEPYLFCGDCLSDFHASKRRYFDFY